MSSGASSRTWIGPSPKRSTRRRRMKGQYRRPLPQQGRVLSRGGRRTGVGASPTATRLLPAPAIEWRPSLAGVRGSDGRSVHHLPLSRPSRRRPSRNWLATGSCRSASARILPSEPPCEVAQQPQARSHGRVGITQFPEGSDERVQVRGEQVSSDGFGDHTVLKGLLEHVSSPFWVIGMPTKERMSGLCRVVIATGESKGLRKQPEEPDHQVSVGIIRESA